MVMRVGLEERVSERPPPPPLLLSIAAGFLDRVIMVVVGWL